MERKEHYTYGLGGGPLHSSGTVGEELSGANKGLQIGGGVPVHGDSGGTEGEKWWA